MINHKNHKVIIYLVSYLVIILLQIRFIVEFADETILESGNIWCSYKQEHWVTLSFAKSKVVNSVLDQTSV